MNLISDLLFWEGIAEIYDTHGVPKDLLSLRLRQEGVKFTDGQLDKLLDYMVRRRNRVGELIDVTTILIRLPEHFGHQ